MSAFGTNPVAVLLCYITWAIQRKQVMTVAANKGLNTKFDKEREK